MTIPRDANGQFLSQSSSKPHIWSLETLPKNNEKCIELYQKLNILPLKYEGNDLQYANQTLTLRQYTSERGDALNDNFALYGGRKTFGVRPKINLQSGLPLKTNLFILYNLLLKVPAKSICAALGWVYITGSGKTRYRYAPIRRLRSKAHWVMAYQQHKKFLVHRIGGWGKPCEHDIVIPCDGSKGGTGFRHLNKCYIQILVERDGLMIMEPYACPRGGSESMIDIAPLINQFLEPFSILNSDGAKGIKAFVMENLNKNYWHYIVNHKLAKFYGCTWHPVVTNETGEIFDYLEDGEIDILSCHTQTCDGMGNVIKKAFRRAGGVKREHVRGELKEIQWHYNEDCPDIFQRFLEAWGDLEADLRAGTVALSDLEELVAWDHTEYDDAIDDEELFQESFWQCPGCNFKTSSDNWRAERTKHKKKCEVYTSSAVNQFTHLDADCACCIYPYHENAGAIKLKATHVIVCFIISLLIPSIHVTCVK